MRMDAKFWGGDSDILPKMAFMPTFWHDKNRIINQTNRQIKHRLYTVPSPGRAPPRRAVAQTADSARRWPPQWRGGGDLLSVYISVTYRKRRLHCLFSLARV